jgi:hypothetical protein
MSDPNKPYNRQNGNSRTANHSLTVLGKDFSSNLCSQSFTDENHGKVKNRQNRW